MLSARGRADDLCMPRRVLLLAVLLSFAGPGAAHAAEPIACPAKVGALELANPNSSYPGTKGSLQGDPQVRASYTCAYGERRNNEPSITGQTFLITVSWAATASDLSLAKGCGETRTGNTTLEVASAAKRAWAEFNIAIEPHTAALRSATQGLLAQAEALAISCSDDELSSPPASGPSAPPMPSTPSTPAAPARRTLRWKLVGVNAQDGFYLITRGRGTASIDPVDGTIKREGQARGKITISFYDGIPRMAGDPLGLNAAPRKPAGRIRLSVHGPGNFSELATVEEDGYGFGELRLVIEVDDVRGTARMRQTCRADPFGTVRIAAADKPSSLGYAIIERVCNLAPLEAVRDTSSSSMQRYLPLTRLQIA